MALRTVVLTLALALVATVTFASAADEDAGAAAEREMVMDPSTGEMISAPEYGGTFTYALKEEPASTDAVVSGPWALGIAGLVVEMVSIADWSVPRDEFDFVILDPPTHTIGSLAESWSQPDPVTYVLNVREGVRWHDKTPMNARLLTAEDIAFNYHRILGLGSGFTERSEYAGYWGGIEVESITATDGVTVVIKLAAPNLSALATIIQGSLNWIYAPEVIREKGDADDWRDLVGTGPYGLTDWTKGSSVTWDKNPDYWGFDEKFPDNRLPYFEQIRALIMPETTTYLSALRTGQIDYVGPITATQLRSIDQLESLQRTNPELVAYPFAQRSDNGVGMNIQLEPFDDIRVRKAMQMALNLEEINQGFYKGFGDAVPQGAVSRLTAAVAVQFEDWPEDVRQAFAYDPAGAEALLDEAGYPRDADGVRFKTDFMHLERYDLNYTELLASYWQVIGVEVEIEVTPLAAFVARRQERDFRMINAEAAGKGAPANWEKRFIPSTSWNSSNVDDEWYNAKFAEAMAASTLEDHYAALRELDVYAIEQFWHLFGPVGPQFSLVQPWVKGYNGEAQMGHQLRGSLARIWFDSSLKP